MFSAQLLQQPRSSSSSNRDNNSTTNNSSNYRETGIIEKLLPSYGFIQCCERQARLFFHYSQFSGNIDHLKLGDPVEFEMTYDRRTGKPIASLVVKISNEAISEELSSARVSGFITIELSAEKEGRVAYENRGECFFLRFDKEDLEDQTSQLKSKDKVTFYIAKDNSGTPRARHICLQDPHVSPQRYQGIICTLKDSFGFIERADVTKEIFFHSSECQNFKQLSLADNVEFSIQTRNNKQVAVNIDKLPDGSVVFEDIEPEQYTGQILETVERGLSHLHLRTYSNSSTNSSSNGTDAFPGSIIWSKNGKELEIPFSERDLKGEFTLNMGDFVKFNIAIDRRDNSKHATNIQFLEESFNLSGEKREHGFVILVEDGFGFIKCFNKESNRVLFKTSELIDQQNRKISLNDEVEFTLSHDQENTLQATRIKLLPHGAVLRSMFDESTKLICSSDLQTKRETGFIVQLSSNYGLIKCLNKKGDVVQFKYDSTMQFNLNDEVEFYLNSSPNSSVAVGVKKLAHGTIIKNIIAENHLNIDLYNTFSALCKNGTIGTQSKEQSNDLGVNSIDSLHNLPNSFTDKLVLNHLNSNMSNQLTNSLTNNLNNHNSLGGSGGGGGGANNSQLANSLPNNHTLANLSVLNSLTNNLNSLSNHFIGFSGANCTSPDKEQALADSIFSSNLTSFDKLDQNSHLNHDSFLNSAYLDFIQSNSSNSHVDLLKSSTTSSSINNSPEQSWIQQQNASLRSKGFVVALKESFGFIENEDHQYEIFFHFSVFDGSFHNLALGQEVEFICKLNSGRYSADVVRKISSGTIKTNDVLPTVFNGIVVRSVRCFNPEQENYCGLIECKDDDYLLSVSNPDEAFEFSMTSLADIHDFIQMDDIVTFQIELTNEDKKRAINVKPVREKCQAVVDSIKSSFGFLNYEVEDGKKLFFHLSEVKDPNITLQEGDTVEFVIVDNKRLKKYSACSLVRIGAANSSQRPERLKSKIQGNDDLNQIKNTLVRQPKGPDGTKGFVIRTKENLIATLIQ